MKGISKLSLAVAMAGYGLTAMAAIEDPGHINIGPVEVTPQLNVATGYDDNVFRDGNTTGLKKKGSMVYSIDPSVEFKAQQGLNTYAVNLFVSDKTFSSESDASYTDYGMTGDIHQEFNSRNRLDVDFDLGVYHDAGSTVNGATDKEAPEYTRTRGGLTYGFGSMEAKARVDVFGSYNDQDYDKTSKTADGYEGRSRETVEYGATAYYRLMPKTDALIEIKQRNLDYDKRASDTAKAGYDITSYLAGLSWDATAKSSGYAKFGRRYRDSAVSGIDTEGFNGWEVGVSYMPRDYSVIQLSTSRDYGLESDNPQNADFTKGTTSSLNWMHEWTSRIGTNLGYSYTDEEVQNAAGVTSKDRTINEFSVSADWEVRRFVTLSLSYTNTDRDESAKLVNTSEDSYRRNVYMLTAEMAL